ncbi:MAG: hypothetical protein K9H64_19680 [Bacteroidales bacterium]|nr:hypothetical protein [Bacteroidales bacterium]MCF8458275.1 hypothetical protein [Bacteroidales bacterium]
MKKLVYLIFLVGWLCTSFTSSAQFLTEDEPGKPKAKLSDRIVIGGNFGLSLGSITYVELSPKIGYKVKPRFVAGIGLKYIYYHENTDYNIGGTWYNYKYESKVYGGSIYGQYTLFEDLNESIGINIGNIVLYTEIEELNVNAYKIDPLGFYSDDGRTWITSTLVGGGIYQPIGPRAGIHLLVLYNLTDELFSPYSNPVIRIGFNF